MKFVFALLFTLSFSSFAATEKIKMSNTLGVSVVSQEELEEAESKLLYEAFNSCRQAARSASLTLIPFKLNNLQLGTGPSADGRITVKVVGDCKY